MCRKHRLDSESKKHVQQQNAAEGRCPRISQWLSSFQNQTVICQQTDHLSLATTIICRCQQTVQLPPVPKPIQLKQTISPKTALMRSTNVSNEIIYPTMYFVLCIVCCVVYCLLCITVLCCANNQMQIFSTKFNIYS